MPSGVYKRISGINCGFPSQGFQKGHKSFLTEKTKRKIGKTLKGFKRPPRTKEHIEKIRKTKLENPTRYWLGKKRPGMTGENSSSWKGGINPINDTIRKSLEYKDWRRKVFKRDNYICQKYGTKGNKIQAHHIQNFSGFPELRFAIDNGITLSKEAHKEFHNIYGKVNNTREQLNEFLNIK